MLKKIYISIFFVIFVFLISCEINPLVGVGSTVDTIAPEVIKVIPADCSYVRDDFDFIITCYDNVLVTRAKLEIERNGEKIFEKSESVSSEKNAGYQTWKVPISLKNDLKISSDKQEGEFKIIVYVYDERENISENSYKSITIVVDVDTANADIYYPQLFKKTRCDSLRSEDINSENFTVFQNSTFQINGECNDNSSIQSVILTLKNENGEKVESVSLDEALKSKKKYVSGSLYNWKLTLSATDVSDDSAIPLNISSFTDTYFYEVFLQVKDGAGNITFTEGNGYEEALGKSFGWFAVRQTADYPFSDFSSINDKVSVNSVLTGKSYDDDGIAAINIYRKPSNSQNWELIKSYSKDGSDADESLDGNPQTFTWKVASPENSTSSSYQLKVEVIDVNGKSSIEGYEKKYLSDDKVFCSFGIVDPTAPSIEPIDLADFKSIVDKDGNFTVTVKAVDNSAVKKIYLAWKPEETEKLPEWNDFANQASGEYKDENGIKYWNISPKDTVKEAEESLTLNIYNDFENIYDKKVFYIYAEDDSGKYTEITSSMPRFTEMPEVKFTSPISGAVETTYNNQQFNIEVEVSSFIKGLQSIEIYYDESDIYNVDISKQVPIYDEDNQLWIYKCSVLSTQWWKSGEGEGNYSLTARVKDIFNNINIDMLSFDIDNGVPKIKSVSAETEPGSYCVGSEIEILVEMKKEVFVDAANKENLTLQLNNGGTAYYNAVATGNTKTKKIYFTYTVESTHSSGALNAVTLKLDNAKIYDEVGNINGLATGTTGYVDIDFAISIEKNSSSMLIIDNTPPKIINVTSITPNGSYTSGDSVNLIVEFDEEVKVSGNPILVLDSSKNQTAKYERTENGKQLYFTYLVDDNVNIDLLEWESLDEGESGVIKDCAVNNKNESASGNKVDFLTLKYSSNISLARSGQKIRIDNEAPKYQTAIPMYKSYGLSFQIIFDESVYKVAGKKAVLHRRADAVPIVLSVDKYNEYAALVPEIAAYYEKGVNGASSSFKIDNTTKYILKYEYEPTNESLLELFKSEKLGFYTQEIMMESDWVANNDDSILITIPQSSLLTGEYYWLTIEEGFVEDRVGIAYSKQYSSEKALMQAGKKAQPPVIRIKKVTGADAKTTTMKINTITKDASVKYSTSGGTPSTLCSGEVTLGTNDYTNSAYKIKASAQIETGDLSYGYELANKTVIYTSHGVKTAGDEVYFRGANVEKGTATVPNFPFSWDEASSPLMWSDRDSAAESGMIKAAQSGGKYYVVSWGITDDLYFRPLSCKKSSNGYLIWAWGQNGSKKVSPGGISDSNTGYEANYHDRFGKNYN